MITTVIIGAESHPPYERDGILAAVAAAGMETQIRSARKKPTTPTSIAEALGVNVAV